MPEYKRMKKVLEMRFSKLASVLRIFNGKKKSDILIILPVYKEYCELFKNLSFLSV